MYYTSRYHLKTFVFVLIFYPAFSLSFIKEYPNKKEATDQVLNYIQQKGFSPPKEIIKNIYELNFNPVLRWAVTGGISKHSDREKIDSFVQSRIFYLIALLYSENIIYERGYKKSKIKLTAKKALGWAKKALKVIDKHDPIKQELKNFRTALKIYISSANAYNESNRQRLFRQYVWTTANLYRYPPHLSQFFDEHQPSSCEAHFIPLQ